MALLVCLAENAGHTVSRERLFAEVWPGVVVTDDTLTQAVIKLRKALGDRARDAVYIQTVTKSGYRLCAPVTHSRGRYRHLPRKYWAAAIALVVLVLAAVGLIEDWNSGEEPAHRSSTLAPTADLGALPTFTVEPFMLLDQDPSQQYLGQGLTYDLITNLAKHSGLWVIGPRSAGGLHGEGVKAGSARFRVSGEVQRSGDELRVYVHLLDVESGRHLWSKRYQRPFGDLFEVQAEISRKFAASLSLEVGEAEQRIGSRQ